MFKSRPGASIQQILRRVFGFRRIVKNRGEVSHGDSALLELDSMGSSWISRCHACPMSRHMLLH